MGTHLSGDADWLQPVHTNTPDVGYRERAHNSISRVLLTRPLLNLNDERLLM